MLEELDEVFQNPNTLLALHDLHTAITVTTPALEFIAPYQTVCGYSDLLPQRARRAPVVHRRSAAPSRTRTSSSRTSSSPTRSPTARTAGPGTSRRGNPGLPVERARRPYGADYAGEPAGRLFSTPYQVAIDAQGNADCQLGQVGWPRGPLALGRTRATRPGNVGGSNPLTDPVTGSGGNYAITSSNFPGLHGATYFTQKLGINTLQDVP